MELGPGHLEFFVDFVRRYIFQSLKLGEIVRPNSQTLELRAYNQTSIRHIQLLDCIIQIE